VAEYCSKCRARLDQRPVAPPYPLCPPEHKRAYDPVAWERSALSFLLPPSKKERTPAAIRQKRYRGKNPKAMEKSKRRLAKRLKEEVGMQKNEYAKYKSARNLTHLKLGMQRDKLRELMKRKP